MPPLFRIKIFENARTVYEGDFSGPVEIGRQEEGEAGPYSREAAPDKTRLVIAALTENRFQIRFFPAG